MRISKLLVTLFLSLVFISGCSNYQGTYEIGYKEEYSGYKLEVVAKSYMPEYISYTFLRINPDGRTFLIKVDEDMNGRLSIIEMKPLPVSGN